MPSICTLKLLLLLVRAAGRSNIAAEKVDDASHRAPTNEGACGGMMFIDAVVTAPATRSHSHGLLVLIIAGPN
jgi:hypothetical protein